MSSQLSPTGRFERIMLATDGSEFCTDAELVSLEVTAKVGGTLLIASVVVTNPAAEVISPEAIGDAEQETRALLNRIYGVAVEKAIAAESVFRRGPDPLQEILAAAEEHNADVIVMGRRGKRGLLRRMIGDATSRAVGTAKCSVLVVPEGATMWRRRILLATDGSRFSDAAAVAATRLAELCRLPVTVVSMIRESFNEERAALAEEAATRVQSHLRQKNIDADKVVLRGDPDKLILETAQSREADLIVMGTHGRTGWERVTVGSVTESVIGASKIPVLAVKA
ncbi:MAG TPA: universal stress protein [Usitatibacteraceae bacterium]|nr:universal stress protein [Usitatibacteraceae bacterium]